MVKNIHNQNMKYLSCLIICRVSFLVHIETKGEKIIMIFDYKSILNKWKNLTSLDCVYYCRVSSKDQEKGTSIEDQKKLCETFCNGYKMNIVEGFIENVSAMKGGKRREFNKMVQMLKEGKAKVLVCAYADRLTRNGADGDIIKELIEDYGIIVVLVVPNRIMQDPVDPADFMLFDMEIAFSNYRVRLDRQRCNAGIIAKNLSGYRSTKSPYGYMNDNELGRAVIIDSRANFVRKAFELYATGNYSVPEVANELFEQGFMYERKSDMKIPLSTLDSMLRNLFYTGKYYVKKADEYVNGTHDAIISDELFEKVQKLLKSAPKASRRYKEFYSNLLTCANCEHYLTQDIKMKPNGKKYVYYRCMNPKCDEKVSVREVSIDDDVNTYLKEIRLGLIPDEIIAEGLKNEISGMSQNLSTLKRNISRKYHSEQGVMEKVVKNGITDEKYINDKMSAIQEKYGDLDTQILATEKQIETVKSKVTETFTKRLYDVYMGFDIPTKRKVLELMANIFKCDENGLKMTFKSAFRKIRRR